MPTVMHQTGLDAYVFSLARSSNLYQQNFKQKYFSSDLGLEFLGHESVAFKLLKTKVYMPN